MTYEYLCKCCSHTFEAEQRITDNPLVECPKCKVASLQRIVSGGSGFLLKGGGWYVDGYNKPEGKVDDGK